MGHTLMARLIWSTILAHMLSRSKALASPFHDGGGGGKIGGGGNLSSKLQLSPPGGVRDLDFATEGTS